MDSADLEDVRAVERQDAAVTRFELCVQAPGDAQSSDEQQEGKCETACEHSRRLLATMAWKSKRDVGSCHIPLAPSDVEGLRFLCEEEGQAFDKLRPNGNRMGLTYKDAGVS